MKTLFFSTEYPPGDSKGAIRSFASYLLPESFPKWIGVTLLSFAASWAGVALGQIVSAGADILWPANGLLLAFLLRMSPRNWFAYLAGSVVANIAVHLMYPFLLYQVFLFSAANVIEILFAAALLTRETEGLLDLTRLDLTRLADLGKFGFFGVAVAPLCATVFVDAVLASLGRAPGSLVPLLDYYVGDAMGIAIMTPLFLAMDWTELAALLGK